MRLLHIVSTPRAAGSNTLRISQAFLETLQADHPDVTVETLDLYDQDLPAVAGENIESKYKILIGQPIDRQHADAWGEVERLIAQFLAADAYLISTPMWNFSIPYALKYYIDAIVQPGYLFSYDEQGAPIGLCMDKKMVCITTRGGDYSAGGPMHALDMQVPYLLTIFGFVGITDIQFVHSQPTDVTPELRETAIERGIGEARALATTFAK